MDTTTRRHQPTARQAAVLAHAKPTGTGLWVLAWLLCCPLAGCAGSTYVAPPVAMPVAVAPDHALASALAPPTPQSTADVPEFRAAEPPRAGNGGGKLLPTGIVFDVIGLALFGAGIAMLDNPSRNCAATVTQGYRCINSYSEAVSINKAMSSIPFAIGAAHLVVGISLTAVGAVRNKARAAR